jgi:hypothetical protein
VAGIGAFERLADAKPGKYIPINLYEFPILHSRKNYGKL